jgi:hypothetical protein
MNKIYLGDSVYAEQEEGDLILTTENGVGYSNRIVLEVEVINALCRYLGLERKFTEQETK